MEKPNRTDNYMKYLNCAIIYFHISTDFNNTCFIRWIYHFDTFNLCFLIILECLPVSQFPTKYRFYDNYWSKLFHYSLMNRRTPTIRLIKWCVLFICTTKDTMHVSWGYQENLHNQAKTQMIRVALLDTHYRA